MSFLSKIFGDANARYIQSLQPIVDKINSLEKDYEKLSDEELEVFSKKAREKKNEFESGVEKEIKKKYYV